MSDPTPLRIRERTSIEVIDHTTAIPRKVRELDVLMQDGVIVERTERPLVETLWQAVRRYQQREGVRGVLWRLSVAVLAWRLMRRLRYARDSRRSR